MTNTQKIIGGTVLLAALVGIYLFFDSRSQVDLNLKDNANNTIATTTNKDVIVDTKTGYTIEKVPVSSKKTDPKPIPDLNRNVVVSAGAVVSSEAKAYAEVKIKALQTRLKSNTSDVVAWIDLGTNQKNAGDYEGAIISWKYASHLSPTDYVSVSNLGNLYAYFIKDNGQAEVYYKQAISKAPNQPYPYVQLAEVYRDVFKDIEKAKLIVDEGLKLNSGNEILLQFKASLNK